jgi:hypothetical protein
MSDLIEVSCFTNLDAYSIEKWPTSLCCRPEKGDTIEAESGKRLEVVQIIHCQNTKYPGLSTVAYLKIELHRS